MRIRYTPRARSQLQSIRRYLAARNPAAAARVLDEIRATVGLLGPFPDLGAPIARKNSRQLVVPRYRYVVVYRVEHGPAHISVLGVFHPAMGSRDV